MLPAAVAPKNRVGNNQQYAATNSVEERIGDPEDPNQSEMLLDAAKKRPADYRMAAFVANRLIRDKCIAAEIAVHRG